MLYPFILTLLAGLATLIGILPLFIKIKNIDNMIAITCSFASGVMFAISVLDLIPGAINYLTSHYHASIAIIFTFIFMFLGIIISLILEHVLDNGNKNSYLYNVGLLAMFIIILHNIPEGIVTFTVSSKNIMLGIPIAVAIALHNIPEGISIAIPIYYSTHSKIKAILYTFIAAMSELIGGAFTYLFFRDTINDTILGIIFSFTAGLMMAIAFDKLLPTGKKYNKNIALKFMFIGFIFMLFSLLLNNLIS